MHAFYTYLEDNPSSGPEPVFSSQSDSGDSLGRVECRA
jgi:hypothetical protein